MNLRTATIRLAASLPKQSHVRTALIEALKTSHEDVKASDPRQKQIERLLEKSGLTEDSGHPQDDAGDWYEYKNYSGRGMNGKASPYAIYLIREYNPKSPIGKKLISLGMSYDNMGMDWIYYFHN